MKKKLSVIVPAYNEGILVNTAYEAISRVLRNDLADYDHEILFVEDGSGDDTYDHLQALAEKHSEVKVIKFANNAGSHMAIRAGLEKATGDIFTFVPCDLQDPPEVLPRMLEALKEPYHIVWAVRNMREDSFSNKLFSKFYHALARAIVSKNIPTGGSSFFMLSSKVMLTMNQYSERNLTLDGLFATMGFKNAYIYYDRKERIGSKSKWTFSRKMKLFIDFFVAYSNTPIRFVSLMGILFSLIGFAWTIYIIIRTIFVGDLAPGWPFLISALLIGFGVTNISLGIIAEYLWRTLDEARKRPRYVIEKVLNMDK